MPNSSPKKRALYFNTDSYPLFGRGVYSEDKPPPLVIRSPFYWWFKFLQLNADYQQTEKNNGVGPCSAVFNDLGAVSNTDFKTWWGLRSHLFAEPRTNYKLVVANSQAELAPFNSAEALNVVVPLNWSLKSLKKNFSLLISKHVAAGKRGVNVADTNAIYKIGSRWNIGALQDAYKVYTIRQANMARGATKGSKAQFKGAESAKFQLAWADVAIRAGLAMAAGIKEGIVTEKTSDPRRVLTILANRHYKRALEFIKASASSQFP